MKEKIQVLFLCTGNSCRSQMAEGLCQHFQGETIEAYSAGIEKQKLNPLAVKVMSEIGVDISEQFSKMIEDLEAKEFDFVITLCDHASETCPFFPAKTSVFHKGFDDPPRLAAEASDEEEAMIHYRRVRDEIKEFILSLPTVLEKVQRT